MPDGSILTDFATTGCAAVAACNCGAGRIAPPDTADGHITGGGYSNGVRARAAFYPTKW